MDAITIGCRLPHGMVLEVGLNPPLTKDGRMVRRHSRRDDYATFLIKGVNEKTREARKRNIPIVAMAAEEPEFTQVPLPIWIRWKKEYLQTWKALSSNGSLFEVEDKGDAKAIVLDAMAHPDSFAPIRQEGDARAPKVIKKANFDDDK